MTVTRSSDHELSQPAPTIIVRPARPQDVPVIAELVRALAEYEKEPQSAVATQEDFTRALFPVEGAPVAHALIAEQPIPNQPVPTPEGSSADPVAAQPRVGGVIGFALWFVTFSTWTGKPGIWLEDLFVLPQARGLGAGHELLATLARICMESGYPRMDWSVLNWNTPSIDFYRRLGAHPLQEWTQYRLQGRALQDLAGRAAADASRPAPARVESPGPPPDPAELIENSLRAAGARGEIRRLTAPVPTAATAAAALGCDVGAIANSLVLRCDDEPLLVLASGGHRVDVKRLAERLGTGRIRRAPADFVRIHTGQDVGGVAPVGHPHPLRTVIDTALSGFDRLWAGGGDEYTMFATSFTELLELTDGQPCQVD